VARTTDAVFVLPFRPGTGHTVLQSYCNDDGSHETQIAVDFSMPIGTPIVAARDGVVRDVETRATDDSTGALLNYIIVFHPDDGSSSFYAHLSEGGVFVEVGQEVAQGEIIGESGDTGRTAEVLHFQVHRTWPPRDGTDVTVTFVNLEGTLDSIGGLREGTFYRALP